MTPLATTSDWINGAYVYSMSPVDRGMNVQSQSFYVRTSCQSLKDRLHIKSSSTMET